MVESVRARKPVISSPVRQPQRFLSHLRSCRQYGALSGDLRARFEADPDFSFSAISQQPAFSALPLHFQKALRHHHRQLQRAHKHVNEYSGKSPQAAFKKAASLSGKITDLMVGSYSLVFTMDTNDFNRFQRDNDPIGSLSNAVKCTRVAGCILHRSFLKDKQLTGLVGILPQQSQDSFPLRAAHEILHSFILLTPVMGVLPMRTLLQQRSALLRQAQEHSCVSSFIAAGKLSALDEFRCLCLNGDMKGGVSREEFDDIMKAYKPIPLFLRQLNRREQKQTIEAGYYYFRMVRQLWDCLQIFDHQPLGEMLLGLSYEQLPAAFGFILAHPHLFPQITTAPPK